MGRVFISHNHIDDPFVDKLAADLEARGITTFVDHRTLRHGQHWPSEVEAALTGCDQMVAVISEYSQASKNCTDEWNVYIEDQKEIIPVWLSGDRMYFRFRTIHYIDFRTSAYGDALQRLTDALTDNHIETVPVNTSDNADTDRSARGDEVLPPAVLNSRLMARYPLARKTDKAIGIATGNIAEIAGADVLINSENNRLRMDRIENRSVSAALNAFGAEWDANGELIRETVDLELQAARQDLPRTVPLGTAVVTGPGSLRNIGVRHIVHVATTMSRRNSGFEAGTPIQLGQCVSRVLQRIDLLNQELYDADNALRSVVMPIFGIGDGGMPMVEITLNLIARAIDYLEMMDSSIETVYFVAYRQQHYDTLSAIMSSIPDLGAPVAVA